MQVFNSPQSTGYARITGLFYLIIAFAGAFSILYVPSVTIVPGDPQGTLNAIAANRVLFNAGIIGEVVIVIAELFATSMLYFMFKPVSATLSLVAALARFLMAAIMTVMLFFTAFALQLDGDSAWLSAFTEEQRAALSYGLLQTHDFGVVLWQVFFTLHLLLLGALVIRSGAFPRLLGILMAVGSIGYLLDSANQFLVTGSTASAFITGVFLVIVTIGEVGFALWLLIKGPRRDVGQDVGAAYSA